LRAIRAPFLTASGIPVLLGALAAFRETGRFSITRLLLTLGGVLCIHIGANLANDFFDEITGCDRQNPLPTPFSGGSRVIQQGLLSAGAIITASVVFFGLGLAQGIWLNHLVPGSIVLVLGVAGIAIGVLYTAVPVKLSYRGIGEVGVFVAFGPLVVAGSFVCQGGAIGVHPFLVSIPAGLLVLAILLVNEVLDLEWDRRAGKRTAVVAYGARRGYLLFLSVYLGAYVWIGAGLLLRIYPSAAAVALAPLPIALRYLLPGRALGSRRSLVRASGLTIASHTLVVVLLAASYLVEG
jgi:1,4-dihydroxy-2-naphthoate octaprenyltransferase